MKQFFLTPLVSRKIDKYVLIPGVIIGVFISSYGRMKGLSLIEELFLLLAVIFLFTIGVAAFRWWWKKSRRKN
ncbi:hypothetical protein [Halobacillus massiliensis]|uniref:hypothetical protein n=1 Tax=Halobacillus massiliensis TaxID=1926286 RepID=UPI0009E19045|nr:hypothetical protein [Halobacillus massiliensis]